MENHDFSSNRVLPAVYGDEISYYEQLCKLTKTINDLIEEFNKQKETYATIEMLNNSQDEQDKIWSKNLLDTYNQIMSYTKGEILRLEKIISDTIAGKVTIFDPTYGIEPRPVEQVVKNVYHWLRYFADYAVTIDNLNLTCVIRDSYEIMAKDFDLYSSIYYSHNDMPMPTPIDQYVKKHDIKAYYFDRIGG